MPVARLVRAATVAEAQGRCRQAANLLLGAARRTDDDRQRFTLTETAYDLLVA